MKPFVIIIAAALVAVTVNIAMSPAAQAQRTASALENKVFHADSVARPVGGLGCAAKYCNTTLEPVYFGGSNVTTANGIPFCMDSAVCVEVCETPTITSGPGHVRTRGDAGVDLRVVTAGGC